MVWETFTVDFDRLLKELNEAISKEEGGDEDAVN
jgi:hypothetical protein